MEGASTTSSAASSVEGGGGRGSGAANAGSSSASDFLNMGMFQQHVPHNEGSSLLSGFSSSLGAATSNGFGNMGGGAAAAEGSSFDLSDFPSLGGGVSGNGLAQALRQQQQQMQLQQQMLSKGASASGSSNLYRLAMSGTNGNTNFNMTTEDFPALGGGNSTNGATGASVSRSNGGLYGNAGDLVDSVGNSAQLDGGAELLGGAGLGGLGALRGMQQSSSTTNAASSSFSRAPSASAPGSSSAGAIGSASGSVGASAAGSALNGDYGLLGLLGVIRMTDADRNGLALGSDLTMLGLNLGTAEQIYGAFAVPWSETTTSATKEPHYQLPSCYYMQPPALKTGHLSKFQLETLFYIFYALPKDVLQAYAAQELYTREWRYHGDSKLWFKRAGPSDGVANSSSGSPQYIYFDINSWERRLFNGSSVQSVTSGFLPEEDVRVKFPSS